MAKTIAELELEVANNNKELDDLRKAMPSQTEQVFGAPHARIGENPLSSRGFQFQRLFGRMLGIFDDNQCKVEMDVHKRLHALGQPEGMSPNSIGWRPGQNTWSAPVGSALMSGWDTELSDYVKSMTNAGIGNADPDEITWLRKQVKNDKMKVNPLSWIAEDRGGTLVAPAEMGELILALRNESACLKAGAKSIGLPIQGRAQFPRQSSVSLAYWVGEATAPTQTVIGTGKLVLSAKKLAVWIIVNRELLRFASASTEFLTRHDMSVSLALGLDYAALFGVGSDTQPNGLINTPNINVVTPSAANTLSIQDYYEFHSKIEQANAKNTGYICNPALFWNSQKVRAISDGSTDTVAHGQFVISQFRDLADGFPRQIAGVPVITSNQVPLTRGNGSQTALFAGDWQHLLIAMWGSMEFRSFQGDTTGPADQENLLGLLTCDSGVRIPGAFAYADSLSTTLGK